MPVPAGLCCKPGGFHIDPMRPVERAVITHGHSDHARPGHGAVLATQETLDMMRLRYGENFAGTTQAVALRRDDRRSATSTVTFHPAGHVLGSAQIAVELQGHLRSSPPATTRTPPIRPARRSSWCPATSSSPRRRSACRCSAMAMRRARSNKLLAFGRAVSRARASGRRLFARQGAARDRAASARPATTSRSICTARWRRSRTTTRAAASTLGELRPVQGREEGRARRHHHALPAVGHCRMSGRGAFPIRSRRLPRAGCGCARAPASAASNCRW